MGRGRIRAWSGDGTGRDEPRHRHGLRHPASSFPALAVMATPCGVDSVRGDVECASDRPKEILKRLRCSCHRAPGELTYRRLLQALDTREIDHRVGQWLVGLAARATIAFDGNTQRGNSDREWPAYAPLAAITHERGVDVPLEHVEGTSDEVTAVEPLLDPLDRRGVTVISGVIHTRRKLASRLAETTRADHVFVVEDDQPSSLNDIQATEQELGCPPTSGHHEQQRPGPRADRTPRDPAQPGCGRRSGVPACRRRARVLYETPTAWPRRGSRASDATFREPQW
ncbi:MAG: transposase family protein [Planctomycetes bacterium]|nr:transposase family protein [Planctomycetota bacterium]